MTGIAALRQTAALLVDYGIESAHRYLRLAVASVGDLGGRCSDSLRALLAAREDVKKGKDEDHPKQQVLRRLLQEALMANERKEHGHRQVPAKRVAVLGNEIVFPALFHALSRCGWRFTTYESAVQVPAPLPSPDVHSVTPDSLIPWSW